MDYAYYLQGLINFNEDLGLFGRLARQDLAERDQQASRDAYESFKQVVDRYPESKYAEDARLRMHHVAHSLANRAQQAIKDYPQSPAIEEALYIMSRAYDQLGLVQLRDDAVRVLKQSFPESTHLSGDGLKADEEPWWQLW